MAEAGIKIVGEEDSSSQSPGVQADKYEEAARKSGWKPEEEWQGNAEDWVPAKEFIGRQKLFDKIHDLKNQLSRQASKFESDMNRIQSHFLKVQETEYKRAKQELETQLKQAKADEDVNAVAEIAGQIKDIEQSAKEVKEAAKEVRAGGPTPEFTAWQERNKWFQSDAEMTADAIAVGTGYAAANPNKSQAEVLDYVEKKIKRLYSEKFEETEPKGSKKMEDNRVEGGGRAAAPSKKKGQLTVSDLDDTQLAVMRTLIKRNALKEVAAKNKRTQQEEYLAQLSERYTSAGER